MKRLRRRPCPRLSRIRPAPAKVSAYSKAPYSAFDRARTRMTVVAMPMSSDSTRPTTSSAGAAHVAPSGLSVRQRLARGRRSGSSARPSCLPRAGARRPGPRHRGVRAGDVDRRGSSSRHHGRGRLLLQGTVARRASSRGRRRPAKRAVRRRQHPRAGPPARTSRRSDIATALVTAPNVTGSRVRLAVHEDAPARPTRAQPIRCHVPSATGSHRAGGERGSWVSRPWRCTGAAPPQQLELELTGDGVGQCPCERRRRSPPRRGGPTGSPGRSRKSCMPGLSSGDDGT